MISRRRVAAAAAVTAAAALVLTACGSSSSGSSSSSAAGSAAASSAASAAPSGGGSSAAAGGAPTGSVTVYSSEPQNPLVPTNTNETGGANVVSAMWTGLVEYRVEDGAPELANAESITGSADYKTWTIKLKPGWTFHDGTPVTAKSYVDAWNYGAFGPNAQINQYFFSPDGLGIAGYEDVSDPKATVKEMKGLKVVDDNTFTVELSSPNSLFETIVGYEVFDPMPASFFADPKAFEANPIGNGPFQFVSRTPSVSIDLKAYPNYGGERKAQVDGLQFKIYQSIDAAYADVVANNLDVINTIPTAALAGNVWQQDLAGRFIEKPQSSVFQSITFPLYDKRFDNAQLRKAISEAIDRKSVIDVAFAGTRVPADSWVPPGNDGYVAGICGEACIFNPDKAKADLAAAGGWSGPLTIAYNADAGHKDWVDAVCVSIKNTLGIDCQGKPYPEFGPFRADVTAKKMTGLFRTGWQADYPSIQNFLAPLYSSKGSANDGGYNNPDFDKLMQEAVQLPADQANAKYADSEKLLAADMPVIPMWFGKLQGAWSDKINEPAFTWQGVVDPLSLSVKQ